jgi:hypothetical protein
MTEYMRGGVAPEEKGFTCPDGKVFRIFLIRKGRIPSGKRMRN